MASTRIPIRPTPGRSGPPNPVGQSDLGPRVAAFAAWIIGVAAGVYQFVATLDSGPTGTTWFLAVTAVLSGVVLLGYAVRRGLARFAIVVAAALPLLLGATAAGFVALGSATSQPTKPVSASITSPGRDETVPHHPVVKGVVVNLQPGQQVWIVVTGRMDDVNNPYQYYVKGNDGNSGPCTLAGNTFECTGIYVGQEQDNSRYALIPVITDSSAMSGFQQCIADVTKQVHCANIRPDGIQSGAIVFVKRG